MTYAQDAVYTDTDTNDPAEDVWVEPTGEPVESLWLDVGGEGA